MYNNRASYKQMMDSMKGLETKEQVLEAKLNDLLEEQILFKDNTFAYVGEARAVYEELTKVRRQKDSLLVTTNQIKEKRDNHKLKNKQNKKESSDRIEESFKLYMENDFTLPARNHSPFKIRVNNLQSVSFIQNGFNHEYKIISNNKKHDEYTVYKFESKKVSKVKPSRRK